MIPNAASWAATVLCPKCSSVSQCICCCWAGMRGGWRPWRLSGVALCRGRGAGRRPAPPRHQPAGPPPAARSRGTVDGMPGCERTRNFCRCVVLWAAQRTSASGSQCAHQLQGAHHLICFQIFFKPACKQVVSMHSSSSKDAHWPRMTESGDRQSTCSAEGRRAGVCSMHCRTKSATPAEHSSGTLQQAGVHPHKPLVPALLPIPPAVGHTIECT